MNGLQRAITIFGSQSALARELKIKPQAVQQWVHRRRVPVERAIQIERATNGRVTRYELRPDIFGEPPEETAA